MSGITHPGIPTTPPTDYKPHHEPPAPFRPTETHVGGDHSQSPPPINVAHLNQSPAPIPPVSPHHTTASIPIASPDPTSPIAAPIITPTVAETGVPVSAGSEGPGPASGSLLDIRGASATAGPRSGGQPGNETNAPGYGHFADVGVPSYESASEEKKRLQAAYSQVPTGEASAQPHPPAPKLESAEEEKKRIEREERERLLRADKDGHPDKKDGGPDDLPPTYQDI